VDANGNTTSLRGMTLGYTPDNRLKTVDTGVAFEYDGRGQRASKKTLAPAQAGATGFSQSRLYVYGQSGELLAEVGPTGKVLKEYIYMNAKPLAMLDYRPDSGENFLHADMDGDGSISVEDYLVWYLNLFNTGDVTADVTGDGALTTDDTNLVVNCAFNQGSCEATSYTSSLYTIHTDHLGTPKLLTDVTGAAVWRAVARPFGKATVDDDVDGDGVAVEFNLRQPGQYYDRETGLYYNYFRYYDPETGRYITSDPIGLDGGINTYVYVENNPLNWVDPLGLRIVGHPGAAHGGIQGSNATTSLNISLGPISVNIGAGGVTFPANLSPAVGITAQVSQPTTPDGSNDYSGGFNIAGNGFTVNEQGDVTVSVGFEIGLPISFGASPNDLDPNRSRRCGGRPCRNPQPSCD